MFKRMILSMTAAGTICVMVVTATPAAATETWTEQLVTNRMDGSRLALLHDSPAADTAAISLRAPTWKYKTDKWSISVKSDGQIVLRNEIADKCLQPSVDPPVAGTTIVVRACNGSALQDWNRRSEETPSGEITGWGAFRPRVDPSLAIALDIYQGSGSWNTLYLNQDLNSTDRLWRHHTKNSFF